MIKDNMKNTISNETLNAYLDGELDDRERYRVTNAIINNPELKSQLDDIEQARQLYIETFSDPPAPAKDRNDVQAGYSARSRVITQSLAATLLVAVSFFAGLQWSLKQDDVVSDQGTFTTIDTLERLSSSSSVSHGGYKALVHFEKFSKQDALNTLNRIDRALAKAKQNNINARIEVIMQGKGLGLLRTDTSPVAGEIRQLLAKHNNLVISACNKTLERLKLEKGIEARLLPDVIVVPSALEQILNRLQHDWLYIKA